MFRLKSKEKEINEKKYENKKGSPPEYVSWFPTICRLLLWFAHRPPPDPAVPGPSVVAVLTEFSLLRKTMKSKLLLTTLETGELTTAMPEVPKDHRCSISILKFSLYVKMKILHNNEAVYI